MSKSILVIDTPNSCADCHIMADKWCYGTPVEEVQDKININKRPKWCPLRPLPEKLDNPYDAEQGGYLWEESFVVGYNQCLDDILGDTEDE